MNELFLGFYLGVFSIILLFNLLSFVYYKEKAYIYYFFMHLSVVLIALNVYGITSISILLLAASAIFFSFLFAKEFLNLNKYFKSLDSLLLKIALAISAVLLTIYLFDALFIIKYFPFSFIFLGLVYVAIMVYKKGFELAKYFIIGWGLNFLIIFFADINRMFDIGITSYEYMSQIGNMLEASILSFALFAKTRILIDEKNEKEKMLIHQSRLASMGEMLANISHQWRQPLNRIASFIMNMQMHIMDNYEKEKYLLDKLEESQAQLEYMSQTIDDFTNFYKKDKQKELFLVSSSIENACSIISSSLKSSKIDLNVGIKNDFEINSYPKELSQVILNLLQNAKDALIINKIQNPRIDLVINNNQIIISDNGEGVPIEIEDKIFEPYFTTKEKHKGTGLGLYMSRMILEKNMNATLSLKNQINKVEFRIDF